MSTSSDSDESVQEEYDVEAIRTWRYNRHKKRREFLIKWRNYDESVNSWEPEEHLNCPVPMKVFRESLSKKKKMFLDCKNPENLTGLQRNAEIKAITADIPENNPSTSSRKTSSRHKFCLLVVFEDGGGQAEEIEFREFCRARPEEAFEFCESRLVSRAAIRSRDILLF